MDAIYNERIKLFATFLNSVGIAIFAVGGLAPLITSFNGQTGPTLFISFMSAVCFLTAIALHYIASRFLKDEAMTTLQMISFMVMPAAGLLLAGAVLFYDLKYPAKHKHRHNIK
ncbi:hypothetical protein [Phyllobacterium sp. K27]